MLTVPVVLLLGLVAVFMVKYAKHKIGGIFVGVLLGLALASTSIGPPILSGLTSLSRSVVNAAAGAVGH